MPYSQRILYTAALLVLGMGYLFATIHLLTTHAGRAGGPRWMLAYQDVVIAYTGSGTASRLESALHGPMASMLPPDEGKKGPREVLLRICGQTTRFGPPPTHGRAAA